MSNIDKHAVQAVADLKAGYTLGHADVAILNELARIALASLEAEAVAWTWEIYGGGNMYAKIKPESLDARPLYTAPPSPVSVPDDEQGKPHPVMAVKGELGFLDHFDRIISERDEDIDIGQLGSSNYEALMLAALDAFRAAMLQGAENAESTTTMQTAPELDYSPKNAESPTGINQGKSEPVTTAYKLPEGWVAVPVEPTEEMCDVGHVGIDVLAGVTADENEYYSIDGKDAAKVYRAMIAAAPQQEA